MEIKNRIDKVAIIGGTHGNELTGVYLVKKWLNNKSELQRETIVTDVFYANEPATKIMKRYVDQDLNRSFSIKDLTNDSLNNTENILAHELNDKIGPKGSDNENFDFIIDLHSTTSNMGITLILADNDPLSLSIAKMVQDKNPDVKIVTIFEERLEQPYITSVTKHAITIEVGAVPQGVLLDMLFTQTRELVIDILNSINDYNIDGKLVDSLEVYNFHSEIDYPKDTNGNIKAIIHQQLQNNDYLKITKGDPLFLNLSDGKTIVYEGAEDLYPIFINEAAYYEKSIAMMLTDKKTIEIS